jgi:hypothetical protein
MHSGAPFIVSFIFAVFGVIVQEKSTASRRMTFSFYRGSFDDPPKYKAGYMENLFAIA